MKALHRDYTNYSAHFLLADLYRDTHLNSRAQTTENLLGRLLAPVNFNSNNFNIGGEAALNEYNTLFDRPVHRTNIEASANSQNESIEGLIDHTSTSNEFGYKIGYNGLLRDGFREEDWQRFHQWFLLGQYQATEASKIVWDSAITLDDRGDIVVNFDPQDEDTDLETNLDSYLARVGAQHNLGQGSHLIGQLLYNYGNLNKKDERTRSRLSFFDVIDGGTSVTPAPFSFSGTSDQEIETKQHLVRGDLQYIRDGKEVSFVAGTSVRYERIKGEEQGRIRDGGEDSLAFLADFPISSQDWLTQYSHRAYLYSTWHLLENLDFTAGLTYSRIQLSENAFNGPIVDENYHKDEWSPKIGFLYQLGENTLLRGVFSQTLDRTGRGNIGPIEPTFVGGFGQVFDGVQGSRQELWGLGIDHKLFDSTYLGLNYQRRELSLRLPFLAGGLSFDRVNDVTMETLLERVNNGGADIDRISSYIYQILGDNMAGRLEYDWEYFKEVDPLPTIETLKIAPRLDYFHPSGFFAFGAASWRYQERGGNLTPKERHDFWIVDAGLGYEFDNRHGAITLAFNNILDRSFRYSSIQDEENILPRFGAELELSYNF